MSEGDRTPDSVKALRSRLDLSGVLW